MMVYAREEIVGKEIASVLQSPWNIDMGDPPIKICSLFARFTDGSIFAFTAEEFFHDRYPLAVPENLIEVDLLASWGRVRWSDSR